MFKSIITPAIAALLLTGSAFAGSLSSDAQLAHSAGVQPGVHTAAEMVNIIEARRENDTSALNFYLSGQNRVAEAKVTQGTGQLAEIAGVEPGKYTAAELLKIIAARQDGDTASALYVLSGENRKAASPASAVTPGEAMLAASAGVDPAQYTLAELIAMQNEFND